MKPPLLRLSELLAVFFHYYPGMWYSPAWRTKNHVIPAPLFFALVKNTHMLDMRHRVQAVMATINSGATIHAGEDGQAAAADIREEWIDAAYPEIARS